MKDIKSAIVIGGSLMSNMPEYKVSRMIIADRFPSTISTP
jgi:hypothetical protein